MIGNRRVADDPTRPAMPDFLRAEAEAAITRHRKRKWNLDLVAPKSVRESHDLEWLACPYREEDWDLWVALLFECFGTRVYAVGQAFMRQLAGLCPEVLYTGEDHLSVDEESLKMAIAIVASIKPRNEAEAALAAQAVACHFAAMKLGSHLGRHSYPDVRSIASLAAITKAYAGLLDTAGRLKGRKSARQTIVVKKENHVHYHDERHVHLREGGRKLGGRPDGSEQLRARARDITPASGAALPSPSEGVGEILPFPSDEGQESVPSPRRQGRRS